MESTALPSGLLRQCSTNASVCLCSASRLKFWLSGFSQQEAMQECDCNVPVGAGLAHDVAAFVLVDRAIEVVLCAGGTRRGTQERRSERFFAQSFVSPQLQLPRRSSPMQVVPPLLKLMPPSVPGEVELAGDGRPESWIGFIIGARLRRRARSAASGWRNRCRRSPDCRAAAARWRMEAGAASRPARLPIGQGATSIALSATDPSLPRICQWRTGRNPSAGRMSPISAPRDPRSSCPSGTGRGPSA